MKGNKINFKRGALFRLSLTLVFMLMALSSCRPGKPGIIPEDKMVDLLADMELTEAYANTQAGFSSADRLELGKKVMQEHDVTEEELDTTLAWYGRNIDKYSKLFEKVDKKIEKEQKKYMEEPGKKSTEPDNLWPYGEHLVISPLSGYDAFTFSLPTPDIEKGSIVKLSFFLPNATTLKSTLGTEYKGGNGEAIASTNSSIHKIEIQLHTDTAQEVSRIFGVMEVKDRKSLPLFLDSISLKVLPYDSLEYRSKKRSQKRYGALRLHHPEETNKVNSDSLETTSSIAIADSVEDKNSKPLEDPSTSTSSTQLKGERVTPNLQPKDGKATESKMKLPDGVHRPDRRRTNPDFTKEKSPQKSHS